MAEEEDGMDENFSDISIRGGVGGIINLRYPEIPDLRYDYFIKTYNQRLKFCKVIEGQQHICKHKKQDEFQLILFQRPRLIPSLFLNASFIPHERSWNLRDKKLRKGYQPMSLWDLIIGRHLEHKKSDEGLLCDVKCNTCLFFAGGIEHLKKQLAWQELSSNSDVFSSPNLIQPHLDTKVIGKVIEEHKQELIDIKKKKETPSILTNVDKGTVLVVSTAVLTATVYTREERTKNKNANMKKQRNRNKKNVKRNEN
ncbi:hypothetical protein Glove_19g268 [Diversispora epigaea]|uniref:Uncharacterized protein n=1 Tax=Diversispora epigaea TaxID=1348612 RepID=A0A397JKU1_9GLOM|nr:hypothetical protein Glove_19g268 [Diversispora epigaea]